MVERSGRALGSPLRLSIRAHDRVTESAWEAVEAVFAAVDAAMSRFREDSELTLLARHGPAPVEGSSRMLVRALSAADRARRITSGRFEPRIVEALERIGYIGVPQGATMPPADARAATKNRIFVRDGRRGAIALPRPVDLGGIGKGLALRWAAAAVNRELAAAGYWAAGGGYLLDAGGDIVLDGSPSPDGPWLVGIEDPTGGTAPVAVLKARGRMAVATSSVRRLRWQRDERVVHHLIDPRTGEPGGHGLLAVTVAGPDPAWAEVWSKALFVEGAGGIAHLARSRGLAAWWVTQDGALEMTAAARLRTLWTADL
jgi:thiamine biosynthesis lipoprotein